jgi:hypothetical protein
MPLIAVTTQEPASTMRRLEGLDPTVPSLSLELMASLRAPNDLIWTGKNAIWRDDSKPLCLWDTFRSPLDK